MAPVRALTDMGGMNYQYKDVALWIEKLHIIFEEAGVGLVEVLPYRGVHKKEFRVAMVHKVMDRIGLELMKDRHRHHSRREAGKASRVAKVPP